VTISRFVRTTAVILVSLGAVVTLLVVTNPAPQVPDLVGVEADKSAKPYVIKLHAQWCPLCMLTRGVWSTIEETYQDRVRLVVFDFTSESTTRASEARARQLGLSAVFDDYVGVTGTILVLNGASREVIEDLHGERDFAKYRTAIDKAIAND
jgi:hypothetical protein